MTTIHFLTAGFVLQALSAWSDIANKAPILIVCGAIITVAFGVYVVGTLYSRRSFKRYLCEFFQKHPFNFVQNMEMTKQIGKFFGIQSSPEDSVELYVAKVMVALGLDPRRPPEEELSTRSRRLRQMAPLPISEHQPWRVAP